MARGTVDNQRHAVEEWLKGLSLDAVSRKCHVSPRCVGRCMTAAGYDPLRPPLGRLRESGGGPRGFGDGGREPLNAVPPSGSSLSKQRR